MPFPGNYDTGCVQGATYAETIVWRDADGNLVNTTDYSGEMQVRQCPDGDALLSWTSDDNEITFGGADGTIVIEGPAADTGAVDPGVYRYDLKLTSPGSVVTVLLAGNFEVRAAITQ